MLRCFATMFALGMYILQLLDWKAPVPPDYFHSPNMFPLNLLSAAVALSMDPIPSRPSAMYRMCFSLTLPSVDSWVVTVLIGCDQNSCATWEAKATLSLRDI